MCVRERERGSSKQGFMQASLLGICLSWSRFHHANAAEMHKLLLQPWAAPVWAVCTTSHRVVVAVPRAHLFTPVCCHLWQLHGQER